MIFPIPDDYRRFDSRPATYTLLWINVLVFFIFFWGNSIERKTSVLEDKWFLSLSQKYYSEWYRLKYEKEPEQIKTLSFAYRGLTDPRFMGDLSDWESDSDPIAFRVWKDRALAWKDQFTSSPLSDFGLRAQMPFSVQWITYQFSHSDILHLLSNMCFLFLLGLWIEKVMGSMFLVGLYLLGGLAGAMFFAYDSMQSLIPMVGASASISAMISFVAVYRRSEGLRYFYFLTPMQGWYGILFLPAWLLIPFYLVSDLTAYLLNRGDEVSGIAHSAHLGGAAVGVILGLLFSESLFLGRGKSTT